MLRSFQDLVRVLTLHPAKYEAIYYPRKTVAGDYDKLFEIIRKGNHENEEDVAGDLFGARDSKTTTRYFTLKSRLKDRIENGFFFLSTERFSHRTARRYAAWKEQIIVWMLWRVGAHETAVQRLEKLAEEAETLGWSDVCIFAYRTIRSFQAQQGSMVLLKKYDALLQSALQRQTAEIQAETILAEIEVFKARETLLGSEHENLCQAALVEIERLQKQHPTYALTALAGKAAQYLAEARQLYPSVLSSLENSARLRAEYPHGLENEEQSAFAAEALPYTLAARDFERCKQAVERLAKEILPEMPEILTTFEYYFATAMQSQNYEATAGILEQVHQMQAFTRFADKYSTRWRVYELYARFVLKVEMPQRPTLFKPRFSVNKMLVERPPFTTDAAFMNCAWLLAQVFFLLDDGDFDGIRAVNAELLPYHDKYLRKDTVNYRLQCFLRMVNYAVMCNFELTETIRKTRKYCDWLASARKFDLVKAQTLEVLPYEHLWALILFRMANKTERTQTPSRLVLLNSSNPLPYYA
jgi:hypothetical protein